MHNLIIVGLFVFIIIIWLFIKLKSWKYRIILLLNIFVAMPAGLLYWFQWGWNGREKKLKDAELYCRQKEIVDELNIIFSGFKDSDLLGGISTAHKDSAEKLLSNQSIQLDTTKAYDGTISAFYHYKHSFRTADIIEIKIDKRRYKLSKFMQTANANYNMGGAVVSGCRIDSMNINGTRVSVGKNFVIHDKDEF